MLTQTIRKKIREQNWLDIEKHDSNPSQAWRRLKDQAITALNDLILLANKLPEDKQKEIFSPNRIEVFVAQMLDIGEDYQFHDVFNPRKAELASRLVNRGIKLNSIQFRESNHDTPSLIEPALDHLRHSVNICNEISYKMRLKNIQEEETEGSGYQYLFSWNDMLDKQKNRLLDFIISKYGYDNNIEILSKHTKRSNKRLDVSFGIDTGILHDEISGIFGNFQITINNTNTRAEACIYDSSHQLIWRDNLLVKEVEIDYDPSWRHRLKSSKPVLSYTNDFNLYIKKKRLATSGSD
jgi:hypothetical protein